MTYSKKEISSITNPIILQIFIFLGIILVGSFSITSMALLRPVSGFCSDVSDILGLWKNDFDLWSEYFSSQLKNSGKS